MGDFYSEKLVKRKTTGKDILIKCAMILLTILSVFLVFMIPFGAILVPIMILLDVFIFRSLDVEYEYQYINGDFDVDKIMHKERRKNVFAANIRDMEFLAPSGTPELRNYGKAQTYDFTSGNEGQAVYEMILSDNGVLKRVLFEPDEKMVEGIWMQSPRKVIRK